MAWNDLASNQMVSYADATDSGFTLQPGQTNPGTLQCMTKNDALTKYVLDSASMASYSANQLVPKSAWVAGGVTSYVYTFSSDASSNPNTACGFTSFSLNLYAAESSIYSVTYFYSDPALTLPFNGDNLYRKPSIHSDFVYQIAFDGTVLDAYGCII